MGIKNTAKAFGGKRKVNSINTSTNHTPNKDNIQVAQEFLESMFDEVEGHYLYLWTLPNRKTTWYQSTKKAQMAAEAVSMGDMGLNVFYGTTGGLTDKGTSSRVANSDASLIASFCLDVDILGAAHKETRLPQTLEDVAQLLKTALPDLEPSMVIDSGNGCHVYFQFKEPIEIESDAEREQMQGMSNGFQQYFNSRAMDLFGYHLDSVGDFARVLRVPGTFNLKDIENPKPVSIIMQTSARYNTEDFERYTCTTTGEAATDTSKAKPFERYGNEGTTAQLLARCEFIRHCRDHAENLPYATWVAMLSNVARCSDGAEQCHALSKPYAGYSEKETATKTEQVLKHMKPTGCSRIQSEFKCSARCLDVKNPFGKVGKLAANNLNGKDWVKRLRIDSEGELAKVPSNVIMIFQNDERIKNKFVFNTLSQSVYKLAGLPWNERADKYSQSEQRLMVDADFKSLSNLLHNSYGFSNGALIENAFAEYCLQIQQNPLIDFLDGLPVWDGVSRIDTLLIDYFASDDTPYTRAVTRKTIIALIRRAYRAGCKFDTSLILKGKQGIGKSTFFNILGGEWYSDAIEITNDAARTYESHSGKWLVEMGELVSMRKADENRVKSHQSARSDRYRQPYSRIPVDIPRMSILVGTTNSDEFLKDVTGNRRFWCVGCNPDGKKSVWNDLPAERLQILAEAKAAHLADEAIHLPPEIEEAAATHQDQFVLTDAWGDRIDAFLDVPLPPNWGSMDNWDRESYISRGLKGGPIPDGYSLRKRVCTETIWLECLDGRIENLTPVVAGRIRDVMARNVSWEKYNGQFRIKDYGKRKGWYRVGST